jgi:hypothetical protein
MVKQIDTIVADIYEMFGEDHFPHDPQEFVKFGKNVEELFHDRFNTVRGKPILRMSNIGRPDRQLWYDINSKEEKEKLPPATFIKFAYGDMIEQMILLYAKMAGHTVEQEQAEVEVDGIKGHIDAIIDGVLVDVKSASTFSFQKFENGSLFLPGNDPFGYVAQLCGYIEATGLKRGGFLAVDKTLGKICFCEIPQELIERYKVRDRIAHIKEVIAQEAPPGRCYDDVPDGKSGNMKLDTGCSYCSHKFNCWDNLRTYYYSTGPRYLTRVLREPKVSEFPD